MTPEETLLTTVLKCDRTELYTNEHTLTLDQKAELERMKKRLANGEPLQYIIGDCDFMGAKISVDSRVLIPRPETEILMEWVMEKAQDMAKKDVIAILDLGTGSGNIPITLAKALRRGVITTVDISEDAIVVAKENARENDVEHHIAFVCEDMGQFLKKAILRGRKYDIIVSNPPYIRTRDMACLPEDVQQEPHIALDGGEDGIDFLKVIIALSKDCLKSGGYLFLEIADRQRRYLEKLFLEHPQYVQIDYKKDYVGTDRMACAKLGN